MQRIVENVGSISDPYPPIWYFYYFFGPVDWGCRIHRLYLCRGVTLPSQVSYGQAGTVGYTDCICRGVTLPQRISCGLVGWGCRIHRVHFWRGVRLPQRVSSGLDGWGCWIHRLYLCREVPPSQRVSWYDTKQSDAIVLEHFGLWSTSSLSLLPDSLWPRSVKNYSNSKGPWTETIRRRVLERWPT